MKRIDNIKHTGSMRKTKKSTNKPTNQQPIPWSRVLLEKLIVLQIIRNFLPDHSKM
jgi:hypothetical protein